MRQELIYSFTASGMNATRKRSNEVSSTHNGPSSPLVSKNVDVPRGLMEAPLQGHSTELMSPVPNCTAYTVAPATASKREPSADTASPRMPSIVVTCVN